ncbi:unnamed protein product [Boreogadus saida]
MSAEQLEEPVGQQELEPVGQQELEPVGQQELEPVGQQELEPVGQQELEPVGQQELEPVGQHEVLLLVDDTCWPARLLLTPRPTGFPVSSVASTGLLHSSASAVLVL